MQGINENMKDESKVLAECMKQNKGKWCFTNKNFFMKDYDMINIRIWKIIWLYNQRIVFGI